jgi:hypothetical protein
MKLFAITVMLFVTFFSMANKKETEKKTFNRTSTEFSDSSSCSKTFNIQLKGNVTKETSDKVIDYILNKKGICNATVDIITKIITIEVIEDMDYKSIKGLIDYAHHLYLLEGSDPTNNFK